MFAAKARRRTTRPALPIWTSSCSEAFLCSLFPPVQCGACDRQPFIFDSRNTGAEDAKSDMLQVMCVLVMSTAVTAARMVVMAMRNQKADRHLLARH